MGKRPRKQEECEEKARRMWGRSKETAGKKQGECVGKKGQG